MYRWVLVYLFLYDNIASRSSGFFTASHKSRKKYEML